MSDKRDAATFGAAVGTGYAAPSAVRAGAAKAKRTYKGDRKAGFSRPFSVAAGALDSGRPAARVLVHRGGPVAGAAAAGALAVSHAKKREVGKSAFGVEGVEKADRKTKALMGGVLGGGAASLAGSATQVSRAVEVRNKARRGEYALGEARPALERAIKGPRRVSHGGLGVMLGSAAGLAALGEHRSRQAAAAKKEKAVTKSAFGVEGVEKKVDPKQAVGTRGDKRNTKYAASALVGANVGRIFDYKPGFATAAGAGIGAAMYHSHRHTPQGAKSINRSRAAAAARRKTAKEVAPTLRAPVGKSAFGIEGVEKMSQRAKRENYAAAQGAGLATGVAGVAHSHGAIGRASDHSYASRLSRAAGNLGGADHEATLATRALRSSNKGALVGTAGIVAATAAAKKRDKVGKKPVGKSAFGVEKHYIGRHDPEHSNHARAQHKDLRRKKNSARNLYQGSSIMAGNDAHAAYVKAHPFVHAFESGSNKLGEHLDPKNHRPQLTSAEHAQIRAMREFEASPRGRRQAADADRAKGQWNPRYEKRRKARIGKSAFGVDL